MSDRRGRKRSAGGETLAEDGVGGGGGGEEGGGQAALLSPPMSPATGGDADNAASVPAPAADQLQPHFTIDEIVQHPLPGYVAPGSIAFSPGDTHVTYLFSPDGALSRKLYSFDPVTGEQRLLASPPGGGVEEGNISIAERLRRERLRERGLGITRYEWSKGSKVSRLMVPLPDGVYIQDGFGAEFRQVVRAVSGFPIMEPQLSADGNSIAYVLDDELYVASATGEGKPRQITHGARGIGLTHGLAEYIAQEEMQRRAGFWWSPDSERIAFTEVDPTSVPLFRIMHLGKASVGPSAQEDHHYPFAGHSNVRVRLGVVPATGGDVVWMNLHCGSGGALEEEEYLARVSWLPDGSLSAQVENRKQTRLQLLRFNPYTGARSLLLEERNDTWINLHDCFTPLHKAPGELANGFVWASERTGFRHLYAYTAAGKLLGNLTAGDWMVESVAGLDEGAGLIYFMGTCDSALETHLYSCPLTPCTSGTPPPPQRLTQGSGRHVVIVDHALRRFVDVYDSLGQPPLVTLRMLEDGREVVPIFVPQTPNPRASRLRLDPPRLVSIPAGRHGIVLYGAVYRPDTDVHGPGPYKTIVSVYGGPRVQAVCNSWIMTVDMRAQYLRSRGYLVWKLDNRGSSRRGLSFESAIKHKLGSVDVHDQETGLKWLLEQERLVDPTRMGVYGWSYGGYLAAMCLCKLPHMFKSAVAGAPVTSWDGYDTHYTEQYMGTPGANTTAYQESSVMHHVAAMRGKLLLVHGMIDENVHFRHTCRLVNALNAASKHYELLTFPDERHMPRSLKDRVYMEERMFEFFSRTV
eukprot:jgi/Chlat1/2780/Chrsp187S02948